MPGDSSAEEQLSGRRQIGPVAVSPVISGINSAYEWRCRKGTALITAQIAEADLNGCDKSIWVEIPGP